MAGEIYGDSFGQLQSNILADRAQRQQALVQSAQLAQQSYAQAQQAQQNAQQHALQIRQLDMQHSQLMDAAAERNRALNIQQNQFDTSRKEQTRQFDAELALRHEDLNRRLMSPTATDLRELAPIIKDQVDNGVFDPKTVEGKFDPQLIQGWAAQSDENAKQNETGYANLLDIAGMLNKQRMLKIQQTKLQEGLTQTQKEAPGVWSRFSRAAVLRGEGDSMKPTIAKYTDQIKDITAQLADVNSALDNPAIQPQIAEATRLLRFNPKLAGFGGFEPAIPPPPSAVLRQRAMQQGGTNAPAATPQADPKIEALRAEAAGAIKAGADPQAVANRFFQMTRQQLQ